MFTSITSFLLRLTVRVLSGRERGMALAVKHAPLLIRLLVGGVIAALLGLVGLAGWVWSSETAIREAKERFARIQPGMSRTEVRKIMGDRDLPQWGQTRTALEHAHRGREDDTAEQITYSLSRFGFSVILEVTLDADGRVARLYCYE